MSIHCQFAKFFANSTWIVPCETLLAFQTIDNIIKPISDQTVWIIDGYKDGYIFGTSYTTIDGNPTAKTQLIGSITPLGEVLLSFISDHTITSGQGKFLFLDGQWQFVMQTNSLNSFIGGVLGITHWSYMRKVAPCDPLYQKLPGVNISVPQFIELFKSQS
ncbi:Hypothetical protein HVR_LOCUS835 [uncultured virus]|nr:Hypothetical protein HVR_LOCUS835 [uncultured virus]